MSQLHREWQTYTLAPHYLVEKWLGRTHLTDARLRFRALTPLLRSIKVCDHFGQKALEMQPVQGHEHTVVLISKKN